MALSVDYVARETAANLRRNLLMTTAAVLTVAISLMLVGFTLLVRQGVAEATVAVQSGVQEVQIFMKPAASPGETASVSRSLASLESGQAQALGTTPQVKSFRYCNQDCALAEFKKLFANQPVMLQNVTASVLPPSFKVEPQSSQADDLLYQRFSGYPGVYKVNYEKQTVNSLAKAAHIAQIIFILMGAIMVISAIALILNTIRMAIFARRREVAVMKLVGAANWFIRVPFMLEGLIQGLVGACAAFLFVFLGRDLMANLVTNDNIRILNSLVVSPGDAVKTGLVILVIGTVIGAASSAVAVRRFLDV